MSVLPLARHTAPDPRLMQRCLLLAVLLHVWLVLVFGNATGTAAPGQGVWGSLTVKLLGRSGTDANAPPGEMLPDSSRNGAAGSGAVTREGGRVRAETSAPEAPGAAEVGRWNPQPVPAEAATTDDTSPAPAPTSTLTLPERFQPIERQSVSAPSARPAGSTEILAPLPSDLPTAIQRLEGRDERAASPLAPVTGLRPPARAAAPLDLPTTLPAPVSRLDAAPALARDAALPRPADLRAASPPTAVPAVNPALPAPVGRLETPAEAARAATLPRASDLRSPAPATAATLPSNDLPAPVQRLEGAANDGRAVPTLTRVADSLRSTAPAASPSDLPTANDLPAPVQRLEAGQTTTRLDRNASASLKDAGQAVAPSGTVSDLSRALPGAVTAPAGPAQGDPNAALRGEPAASARASAGSPDAGSRLGPDLAVPPSSAASAPRAPLNLSLPRGGVAAARRGPGLVDLLPQPPERKSKLEQSIEDAANKDCRKAYAESGLLAALPLAVDAARGKGCKW